jgi:hypothetical protein
MTNLRQTNKPFLITAVTALLVIVPLLLVGVHDSTDLNQHIQFASTFYHSILAGDYYPSWSGEENFGYGSVGLRFYPPLFQFLLGLARIATGDWHLALCIVLLIFSLAGALGVYLWAKEFIEGKGAAIAATAFLLMPYILSQVYTSAFYAQSAAISILPFSFLFVTRLSRNGKFGDSVGLAISLSLVILTNLPATVIGCISLLIYSLASLERRNLALFIVKLSCGVGLALMATAFYWLRMYPELEFFRNTQFWTDQTFNWKEHFLLTKPSKVVFGIWFNNYTLITTILLAFCGLGGLSRAKSDIHRPNLRPVVILFFFSIFIMTPLSMPLWLYIPYLNEVQFPARWQIITSVTGSIIFGAGAFPFTRAVKERISIKNPRVWLLAITLIAVVIIFSQLSTKYYRHLIPPNEFNAWCENDINSLGYEFFWTLQAKKEAFAVTNTIVSPERAVEVVEWKPGERRFRIAEGPANKIRIPTLYYPRWQASVNGQPTELSYDDDGAMLVSVPPAKSDVRIWFQEAWYVERANYVSAMVWLVLFLAGLYSLTSRFYNLGTRSRNSDL